MLTNLSNISLFEGLNSQELDLLQSLFETYSCVGNTAIFRQGQRADFWYLILKGHALVQYKPYDGPSITLARLQAGDVFGWSGAVGNASYQSSILSLANLQAIRIHSADWVRLIGEYPATGAALLNRLAQDVSGRWDRARMQWEPVARDNLQLSAARRPD